MATIFSILQPFSILKWRKVCGNHIFNFKVEKSLWQPYLSPLSLVCNGLKFCKKSTDLAISWT